jgi:hypothetical protein
MAQLNQGELSMGMFDYIKCEMPLPETPEAPPFNDGPGLFQTKDTPDQYMTTYTITADGKLTWRPYEMGTVPPEERRYPDPSDPMHWVGSMRRIEQEPEAIPFHGDIEFGTISLHRGRYVGGNWEYLARFTEGVCKEIKLVEFTPTDLEKIAAIEAEFA